MLSLNKKLSEVQLLCFTSDLSCIASILFICEHKFYTCVHVKITWHWKSTLSLKVGLWKGGTQHSVTSQICSQVKIFHLQSLTKVLEHLHFLNGCFPIHTCPTPPLTPQTTLDACIQNFFWVFFLIAPWWEWVKEALSVLSVKHKALCYDRKEWVFLSLRVGIGEGGYSVFDLQCIKPYPMPDKMVGHILHHTLLSCGSILSLVYFFPFVSYPFIVIPKKNNPRIKLNNNIHVYKKNKP